MTLVSRPEHQVADDAAGRHHPPDVRVAEAVALGVVGVAVDHRVEQPRQVGRVHLPVAGHHRHDLGAELEGCRVAAGDGRADAAVVGVGDQRQARAAGGQGGDRLGRAVDARVVDDDDQIDEAGHGGHRAEQVPPDVVGRQAEESVPVKLRSTGVIDKNNGEQPVRVLLFYPDNTFETYETK